MKKTLILSLILLAFSVPASADTIIFRDGMRVDAPYAWEESGEVKCEIGGIVFGYPKADVVRIEKGLSGGKKAAATLLEVHKEVTVVPEKETATQQKDTTGPHKKPAMPEQEPVTPKKKATVSKKETAVPQKEAVTSKKETVIPKKEASVPREPKAALQKAASTSKKKKGVPGKEIPASKKENPPKAVVSQYAGIPSFKEVINEDDNNAPVYIKRRRVLLIPRGLAKARIRALLLSYEKKLRNELNAQKAKYKLIVVWAYDDFDRADEGAAGWAGMISNEQKAGKLFDNPELLIR
jgi:outer membrane biosynthesis protein TonB